MKLFDLIEQVKKDVKNMDNVKGICIIFANPDGGAVHYRGVNTMEILGMIDHAKYAIVKDKPPLH